MASASPRSSAVRAACRHLLVRAGRLPPSFPCFCTHGAVLACANPAAAAGRLMRASCERTRACARARRRGGRGGGGAGLHDRGLRLRRRRRGPLLARVGRPLPRVHVPVRPRHSRPPCAGSLRLPWEAPPLIWSRQCGDTEAGGRPSTVRVSGRISRAGFFACGETDQAGAGAERRQAEVEARGWPESCGGRAQVHQLRGRGGRRGLRLGPRLRRTRLPLRGLLRRHQCRSRPPRNATLPARLTRSHQFDNR